MKIERLTQPPKHHLFGFHDLNAWNYTNDRLVALQVEKINVPPSPDLKYGLGYINDNRDFMLFGETSAFNYPQGARQQWIGQTNNIIVNDIRKQKVISKIYNTDTLELVSEIENSTHVITDNGWAFGIDYTRLYRLGAYGYAGTVDLFAKDDAPNRNGIIKHNIFNKEQSVLLSVNEIANFEMNSKQGKQHYITHLVLSPNQERIAFLHRYKLKDGGEVTRLCTIGTNGDNLRCLLTGFYSHFNWIDNNDILMWKRLDDSALRLRSSNIYKIIPSDLLSMAKYTYQKFKNSKKSENQTLSAPHSWIKVKDNQGKFYEKIGVGIINEDGHPMFCPTNTDWMISDTYLNSEGIRTLFLYNIKKNERIDLGKFEMIDEKPDIKLSTQILKDTDKNVLKNVGIDNLAFTRSGLHCDLHPRWSPDGNKVSFDSIHEGTRQVYMINVERFLK